jgi:DNA-binding transcriptional LysR family regulator
MPMGTHNDRLDGMTVFVRVVEHRGFSKAAEMLGHSTSYVSKEVSRLEDRLGVRLLNRTTRSISLTDLGRTYFERCSQILTDAEEVERQLSSQHEVPSGLLKIGAPASIGHIHLVPLLPQFLATYPNVQLEVDFNDRVVDLVGEGFDVVIRGGQQKNSNLITRKLMDSRGFTVASPEYLERRGIPKQPQALAEHDCITYSNMPTPTHWEFSSTQGKSHSVTIKPRVVCNNVELEMSMVLAGMGIALLPEFCCEKQIREGKLVRLLEDYPHEDIGIYAMYPHRRHLSAKVRVFVDFMVEQFQNVGPVTPM